MTQIKFILGFLLAVIASGVYAQAAPNWSLVPPATPSYTPPAFPAPANASVFGTGTYTTTTTVPSGTAWRFPANAPSYTQALTGNALSKALGLAARFALPIWAAVEGSKWLFDCDGGGAGDCPLRPVESIKQADGTWQEPAGPGGENCVSMYGKGACGSGIDRMEEYVNGVAVYCYCYNRVGLSSYRQPGPGSLPATSCPLGATLDGVTCIFDSQNPTAQSAAREDFVNWLDANNGDKGLASVDAINQGIASSPDPVAVSDALTATVDSVPNGRTITLASNDPVAIPEPATLPEPDPVNNPCPDGYYQSSDFMCYPLAEPVMVPVQPQIEPSPSPGIAPEIRFLPAPDPAVVPPPDGYALDPDTGVFRPIVDPAIEPGTLPAIDPVIDPATGFDITPLLQPSPAPSDPAAPTGDQISNTLDVANFPLLGAIQGWQLPAHSGQCILGSFNFSFAPANYSQDFTLQPICDRFEEYRPNISAFFAFMWSIIPLFVVLRS